MEVVVLVFVVMEDVMKLLFLFLFVVVMKKLCRFRKVMEVEIVKNDGVGECDVVFEKVVIEVDEVLEC